MTRKFHRQIISLVREASKLARSIGIPNLLQPGLVKEMIIAELLGHKLITSKRDADARDPKDPSILYEYLSCVEGGAGQLDRMFKEPPAKQRESMRRILRNTKIYFAVFYKSDQTRVKVIYELDPATVGKESRRKLSRSSNKISHLGFSEKWARENGRIVYHSK